MADRDILPDSFKPRHYDLLIKDLDFNNWTYNGTVRIDGELAKPTNEIVLNTLELKVHKAAALVSQSKSDQSWESSGLSEDKKAQRTTITFPDSLPVSQRASVTVEFSGELNHDMAGFYRSQYKPAAPAAASVPRDDEWHYMLSTQFEACDARRAFPCFDEPNLKATFDFAIEIPEDQVALSNMPVKDTQASSDGAKKTVYFARTPVMSTYLLAWAVGDFEYIEACTDRKYNGKEIPVRVYTTRGLKEQGRWALQHAPKIIDYFSEQFEIDYPLPKSDILAVHEFTHGAMENWGLVTYRMTAILFDEKLSDSRFRNRVAYVVAHELAHQWFGNLVTMDWWDELWLNEGFATWAGWLATDHLHPEWEVWPQLVHEGLQEAFSLDGIRASHPIQVPVRDALDVNQIFDKISYLKGCSMIRMLASNLGVKVFLQGIALYLKEHAYGNAKTTDLWSAMSKVSGVDVNSIMSSWIEKIGFPVVTVTESAADNGLEISLEQSRFLRTGDVKPEDDKTIWWVPLALKGKTGSQGVEALTLESKESSIHGVDKDFYLINADATGFYRVNYPESRLQKLGAQLDKLSSEDKIFITSSAADLAFAGYGTTAAFLSFVRGLTKETHYRVLSTALDGINGLKSIFGDDEDVKNGLQKLTLEVIDKALKELGWDAKSGEDFNTGLLRKRVLVAAIANGHQETIDEGVKRWTALRADPEKNALPADLRTPVYRAAMRTDPANTVKTLKDEWYTTPAVDGKEICLQVLSQVQDEGLIKDVILPFNFNISPPTPASEAVPAADMHYLGSGLAGNRLGRPLLWQFMRDNWDQVTAKLSGNPIVLDRLVGLSLSRFSDDQTLAEIEKFFTTVSTKGFDRTLGTALDRIRARAAYRARDAGGLKAWLKENRYV